MNILLVDDDPVQLEMATVSLRFAGHKTSKAATGAAGLESLGRDQFDIVLLDHDMPGMSGLQVLMQMRERGLLARTPVVYVTGRDDVAVIDRAFEIGASGFVVKPVNWTLIQHQMRFVVRAAENERTASQARDAALRLARTKDHLLNIVRHELVSPLGTVIGFGRLVRERSGRDHALSEEIGHLLSASETLKARIDEMMTCVDLESGRTIPNLADEDAAALIEECLPKWRRQAAERSVEIVFRNSAAAATTLRVDAHHLFGMLDRLVDNALRHGRVTRTITLLVAATGEGALVISVLDDGAGIPSERLAECLEAFGQSDIGEARSVEGLGLGLHVVRLFAALNGARLDLRSAGTGQGVEAALAFPRGEAARLVHE